MVPGMGKGRRLHGGGAARAVSVRAWWLALAASASCRAPVTPATSAPTGVWSYEVSASLDGRELRVQATLPPRTSPVQVDDRTQAFVRELQRRDGADWRPAGEGLSCREGCVV